MTFPSYAVTRGCNSQTQQRRGKLGGYAVTRTPIHVCGRGCACACAHACGCASGCNRVTVQLARRAAGFVVTRARNRVTHSLFSEKEKRNMDPITPNPGADRDQPMQARREAMPTTSAFIDMCRAAYGAAFVDQQLATAQQALREHAHVLAEQGEAAAARWLKANAHRCTFFAEEGGRRVGLASPWGRAATATTAVSVVAPQASFERAAPPVGTPPAQTHRGNSAPALGLVAGVLKSELLRVPEGVK